MSEKCDFPRWGMRRVEGDPVEKEVEVFSGSVIDADDVQKVLIEGLRLGVALFVDSVTEDGDGIWAERYCALPPVLGYQYAKCLRIRIS